MSPLDELALALEGRLTLQIREALRLLQLGIDLRLIERLIVQRELEKIVQAMGWEHLQNVLAAAQPQLIPAREAGWQDTLQRLPNVVTAKVRVELSLAAHTNANPESLARLQQQDLSRITALTRESQEAVRAVLERGLAAGRNPKDLARELQGIAGLNTRQAEALRRFRTQLEAQAQQEVVDRVASAKGPVSARLLMAERSQQIDRAVARRRAEYVAGRAETIARTETMRAIADGKRLQRERLVAEGALDPDAWEQEWITAEDERTCPVCLPLHGQRAPIGGAFLTSVGPLSGPPAHPRCRCDTRLIAKGFRRGEHPTPVRRNLLRRLAG